MTQPTTTDHWMDNPASKRAALIGLASNPTIPVGERLAIALQVIDELERLAAVSDEHFEQWGTRIWSDGQEQFAEVHSCESRAAAEARVDTHARHRALNPPADQPTERRWVGNAQLVVRTVHLGPWREVTP